MDGDPTLRTLKYSIDCGRVYQACTVKIVGAYDEVLDACVAHARRVHGSEEDEARLRRKIEPWIRQEAIEWIWPSAQYNDRRRISDWPT